MRKCVICGTILDDENRSKEHIIHNAIGGTMEDDTIYCKKCNATYGSGQDKAFAQIFAPIVDRINIHKNRKTKGTSYTGIMCDENGSRYTAVYKNRKVVELKDSYSGQYTKYEEGKFRTAYYDFKLENEAFKQGLIKIVFNYAIHCGVEPACLEKVFDFSSKKIINSSVMIPFVPMTLFDCVLELHPIDKMFHAVRIFNYKNDLFAYIELFNTFQYYILLSEKYDFVRWGNIDKSNGNVIEEPQLAEDSLLESVTPKNYKDLKIISTQYQVDIDRLIEDLKIYHDYDNLNSDEQEKMMFAYLGKKVYEQIRKQSYVKEYKELLKEQYDSIDFAKNASRMTDSEKTRFMQAFRFYTIYSEDCINIERYKKIYLDGSAYPNVINNDLDRELDLKKYGNIKFEMLSKHLNK